MRLALEVDHQVHAVAERVSDSRNRREIVRDTVAAEPQFQAREAALTAQLDRFGPQHLGFPEP